MEFADLNEALRYLEAAEYIGYDEGVPAVVADLERLVLRTPLSQIAAVLKDKVGKDSRWGLVGKMEGSPVAMVKLTRAALESEVSDPSALRGKRRSRSGGSLDHLTDTELGVAIPEDVVETLLGKAHPTFLGDAEPESVLPWSRWLSPVTLAEYGLVSVLERWRWDAAGFEHAENVPNQLEELSHIIEDEILKKRRGMFKSIARLDHRLLFDELDELNENRVGIWDNAMNKAIVTKDRYLLDLLKSLGFVDSRFSLDWLSCAIRERNSEAFATLCEGLPHAREKVDRRLLFQALTCGNAEIAREALRRLDIPVEALSEIHVDNEREYRPDDDFFPFDDPRITPAVATEVEQHYGLSLEELRLKSTRRGPRR